jgi:phosphatidylinositol glycan class B
LHFNITQGLAVFYGRNRLEYYFTEGLGLLLTTALPFAVFGVFREISRNTIKLSSSVLPQLIAPCLLSWTTLFVALVLSIVSHKEVRFLYPLLPALHIIAGSRISDFLRGRKRWARIVVCFLVLCNVILAYYVSQVHQRGVVDVIHYIRERHEDRLQKEGLNSTTTAGIFMPCHSTPWRSHLVYSGIDIWALTCEPPIGVPMDARESYMDEADYFYADPSIWIEQNMVPLKGKSGQGQRQWPENLIFFDQLEPKIRWILEKTEYKECWRTFNSHWHDDSRRTGDVIVWCRPT